jgi:hypothetical protein
MLPLVVGVTGHRDLEPDDTAEIEQRVRDFFAALERAYPHTPIVLLSSLAEGADRLVARTALDCGAQLYVVLPMQVALYEQDFSSTQSREEFRALMARRYDAGVIPMSDDADAQEAKNPGPARDLRYVVAGAWIVSHSEILIALWDGYEDEMPGGTSQIVRFALQGVPPRYLGGSREALRSNETGAVYHVPVRRRSRSQQPGLSTPATWRYPEAERSDGPALRAARDAFEENLRDLDRFNRDAAAPSIAQRGALSAASLLTTQQDAQLGTTGFLQYTRQLFGRSDALALYCRNWTHMATIAIFAAIGVAAVFFAFYSNVLTRVPALYFAFLGVVAAAFAIDLIIIRKGMQDRFQDYRALAEGVRVQFYWRLAGIGESVYDHYFARQEGELDWIRNAMRAARFRRESEPPAAAGAELQARLDTVLARWVNDQSAYFFRAVRVERTLATRIKWGASACLILTGVLAIALAVQVARDSYAEHGALVAILTLALAGAGLFTGYGQKRAHEEHARRYRRMHALYRIAGDRATSCLRDGDIAAARSALIQLGREALAETCDWLLLHRERQIDVPTA